jgi:putative hemolysin
MNMNKPVLIAASRLFFFIVAIFLFKCVSASAIEIKQPEESINKTAIANPASVNCIEKKGYLSIRKRGDGGEYGICIFKDGRQCEEWALMRGECPPKGIRVAGYITPAAQYCVITGGTYTATGKDNTDTEQGICISRRGARCNAWDLYNGRCNWTDKTSR